MSKGTSSLPDVLDVQDITQNQPFCAGVIVIHDGCLLATLNTDGLPADLTDSAWRIGGFGGCQERGETMSECAVREAREELCVDVRLVHASVTYFHDVDSGAMQAVRCSDAVAPFLLQRKRHPSLHMPYRPGLPTGPYIYFGLFFAEPAAAAMQPGDDVAGLLLLPVTQWRLLEHQPAVDTVLCHGAKVIEKEPLDRRRRLWLHPEESFTVVAALLGANPELIGQ